MSPSMTPEMTHSLRNRRSARVGVAIAKRLILVLTLSLAALTLFGCGGGDKAADDVVLATVGGKDIMGSYYEDRLSLLERKELPRDDSGQIMDMATLAGKEKFLETIINKEVMATVAMDMGYDADAQIAGARKSLMSYEARLAMWANEINEPANFISEEELQEYYAKIGLTRECRYLITNFPDQAAAAREMAVSGADWDDVVTKYHEGDPDPKGLYEIKVPWGRYNSAFGDAVFAPEVGSFTDPIESVYGFWVLKIMKETTGERPPLEDAKARILDSARARVVTGLQKDLMDRVHTKYKFFIDEDALLRAFDGLPANEDLFYEGTKDPVNRDDLAPLGISTQDRELVLYGFVKPDGAEDEYTLGDFKAIFDRMSVFQRPKRAQMVGGLRQKITEEVDNTLLDFEARDLGYYEDPGALLKVNAKIEEMLVSKLYGDMVSYNKRITPEELDLFWAEHVDDYFVPETRSGRLVVCGTQEAADKAFVAVSNGMSWRDVLVRFGTDKDNKARAGKVDNVRADQAGAVKEALFALQETGEIGTSFRAENGSFCVVTLESINEPHQVELMEISEQVGERMKQRREEDAFQAALIAWKKTTPVVTYPENLAGLKSWQDLTVPAAAENPVPRKQ